METADDIVVTEKFFAQRWFRTNAVRSSVEGHRRHAGVRLARSGKCAGLTPLMKA